ncbi:MAG TPA: hypothetical protein VGL77_19225, partial [Armatimonadota bacterium]
MIFSRQCRIIVLIVGLLGLSLAVRAQDEERVAGAETIITRAQALGDKQDYNGAVNMLRQALERYPTYPRLYQTLADWQMTRAVAQKSGANAAKGAISPFDIQEIFDTLGLAMMYLPDVCDTRQRVSALISESFPVQLGTYGPLALPAVPTPFTFTLSDPRLPANQRGPQQGLVTMQPLPVSDAYVRDPKYGANDK